VTDEVHRTSRAPNDLLKNLGFMTDVSIDERTALGRASVAEQARRHASEAVLPLGDDWPPCSAGAAGARHKHDGWPLAALVVVNIPAHIFDHGISNLSLVTVLAGWRRSQWSDG
jgi:hypothetical protein